MGVILLILLSLAVSFLATSGSCLASLLASSRPWHHRNRHFCYRVLVEAGARGLDYPRTPGRYLSEQ